MATTGGRTTTTTRILITPIPTRVCTWVLASAGGVITGITTVDTTFRATGRIPQTGISGRSATAGRMEAESLAGVVRGSRAEGRAVPPAATPRHKSLAPAGV